MKSIRIDEISPDSDSNSNFRNIPTGQHQYYFGKRAGKVVLASLPRANGGHWIEEFFLADISKSDLLKMDSDATIELANGLFESEMKTQRA